MVKKFVANPLFLLVAFIFSLLIIPEKNADHLRTWIISGITPRLKAASHERDDLSLELENQMLREQFQRVLQWVGAERELHREWNQFVQMTEKSDDPFFERRGECLKEILNRQLHALPARVIFREPGSWSNTIWINVGNQDNREMDREVVTENSPVVVGKCVVGVIEKVTEKRSKVRLITDPALTPSVRVVRGAEQNRVLYESMTQVSSLLEGREDLTGSEEAVAVLNELRDQLERDVEEQYLAKGVLVGSTSPKWRLAGQTLKGVGFNYDFADREGEARILRTGETLSGRHRAPLIQTGDLLLTTGFDGIFPADLHVAVVTKILPLHEGGTSYSLEAKPLAPDLNSLREVFVLPPS